MKQLDKPWNAGLVGWWLVDQGALDLGVKPRGEGLLLKPMM